VLKIPEPQRNGNGDSVVILLVPDKSGKPAEKVFLSRRALARFRRISYCKAVRGAKSPQGDAESLTRERQ